MGTVLYGPVFAAIYDGAMADAALPAVLAGLGRAIFDHKIRARSIADVGCGTGRLLDVLARPGLRLYGVDAAPAMLRVAQRRLGPACVTLLQQDLRALALPARVDLILCTFATLNYMLNDASLAKAFAAFARNLKSGGHLVFDFIPREPNARLPTSIRQQLATPQGRSTWRIRVDPRRGLTETRIVFEKGPGAPAAIERHVQRWHALATIMALLRRFKFKPLACTPLGPGGPSPWLMAVARRADRRAIR